MRSQIHAFLSQPLLLDPMFAARLAAYAEDSSPDRKGLFVSSQCPKMAAEKVIAAVKQTPKTTKMTAVLPVFGMIDQHNSDLLQWFGGTSTDALCAALDMLANEDRIANILLRCHSPGGSVYGTKECADKIFALRSAKPICAVADSLMASACYYIGAACSRVYATNGADVGSVGVYQMHFDESQFMERVGIKASIIREPEFKAEGNPYEPLTDAATTEMKADVHRTYETFVSDIAKYRGIDVQNVKDNFGKGRCLDAASAVKCGMVNRVATFGDVLSRMQAGTIRPGTGMAAMDEWADLPDSRVQAQEQRRRRLSLASAGVLMADTQSESMPDAPDENPGGLFADLLHAATAAHMLHLQTRSFSQHMALGALYEALPGAVDELIESYQGKYGVIRNYPSGFNAPAGNPLAFVRAQIANLKAKRSMVGDDTELQNLVDEIASLLDGTEYKLRFLA